MSELLHNVHSIFKDHDGLLIDKGYYNIPLYQRGYKWSQKQVEKLLDDINRFLPSSGKFYCVQNITLVPDSNGWYNVVDGQQRLTTMVLILSALGEKELVKNKVRFPHNSIREKTNSFLNDLIANCDREDILDLYKTWNNLISEHPHFDHQDIYYIYHAYKAISDWLHGLEDKDKFKQKLLNDVKFISNYIEGQEEEKIFGNLNSKRIYLDGADLVRAILITRVTNEESKRESDIKNIVRVNERRVRIGWHLDEINYWWSQPYIREYFNPWIKLKSTGDTKFDREKHSINNLLFLFAEIDNHDVLSLEIIESYKSALQLYKKIDKVNSTLRDWYNDKEIYHYLGFLFAQKRSTKDFSFKSLWRFWNSECNSRKDFKTYLLKIIKVEIFGKKSLEELFENGKNWYEGDPRSLVQILLLLDIIDANLNYKDRLKSHAFFKSGNDIEHIFPQNPEDVKDKKGFIDFLLNFDEDLTSEAILTSFEEKKENEDYQEKLNVFLDDYLKNISVHSIGNLVLLYDSLNRSIGRKPYTQKRRRVLQHFNEGNYIQPHTLKVFARYFQDEKTSGLDLEHWTQHDIEANENSIMNTLSNFFKFNIDDGQK
ncbi:DUF262 domain-containing protein [Pricia sp. S334]|uniref:DUF262 domain-containing protein n=1 Tax=Pricia mediterranea TaxID=3076079 RepID=A0ABU3L549_9FLAO|nr:DUF262 domain-containing protein [Pricia sp. S334]MDT7828861.1 DUF262 domain-containing protein [Pricia sp. S334]